MYTIRKLRQMGKERGIKYFSKMNSKTLCEKLGLTLVRNQAFDTHNKNKIGTPVPITIKNMGNGEILQFPSIYKAAKHLNVNPNYIYKFLKEKTVLIKGCLYSVSK